jgi:hypothetical protein
LEIRKQGNDELQTGKESQKQLQELAQKKRLKGAVRNN